MCVFKFQSQNLMRGPYESLWYIREAKTRKNLYILVAQYNKKIVFSAGPFAKLTVDTFMSVSVLNEKLSKIT